MHANIYSRISSDDSGRQENVDIQEGIGIAEVYRLGATSHSIYRDNNVSAAKRGVVRPDYRRLLSEIRAGKKTGDMVWVLAQDRLARQPEEFEAFLGLLDVHRLRFVAHADGIDLSGEGDLLSPRIRSAVAAEEIRRIQFRVRGKIADNAQKGRRHGKVPFGWKPDGSLEESETALIREVAQRVYDGESVYLISQELNTRPDVPKMTFIRRKRDGISLSSDEQEQATTDWTMNSLRRVLTRLSNIGTVTHRGKPVDGITAQWQPILDPEVFAAIQPLLSNRQLQRQPRGNYLFSGLIRCATCRTPCYGAANRAKGREYPVYRCKLPSCQRQVRTSEADPFLLREAIEVLRRLDFSDVVRAHAGGGSQSLLVRLDALRARLAEIDARYLDVDAEEPLTAKQHHEFTAAIQHKINLTQREIDETRLDAGTRLLRSYSGTDAVLSLRDAEPSIQRAVIERLFDLTLEPSVQNGKRASIEQRVIVKPRTL